MSPSSQCAAKMRLKRRRARATEIITAIGKIRTNDDLVAFCEEFGLREPGVSICCVSEVPSTFRALFTGCLKSGGNLSVIGPPEKIASHLVDVYPWLLGTDGVLLGKARTERKEEAVDAAKKKDPQPGKAHRAARMRFFNKQVGPRCLRVADRLQEMHDFCLRMERLGYGLRSANPFTREFRYRTRKLGEHLAGAPVLPELLEPCGDCPGCLEHLSALEEGGAP